MHRQVYIQTFLEAVILYFRPFMVGPGGEKKNQTFHVCSHSPKISDLEVFYCTEGVLRIFGIFVLERTFFALRTTEVRIRQIIKHFPIFPQLREHIYWKNKISSFLLLTSNMVLQLGHRIQGRTSCTEDVNPCTKIYFF